MRILLIEDDTVLGAAVRDQIAAGGHSVDWVMRLDVARVGRHPEDHPRDQRDGEQGGDARERLRSLLAQLLADERQRQQKLVHKCELDNSGLEQLQRRRGRATPT